MENKQYIHIATFGKPIGLKGYIKINIHLHSVNFFKSLDSFLDENGNNIWVFEFLKEQGQKLIGKLTECNNRDCAFALTGKKIFISKKKFPRIKDNIPKITADTIKGLSRRLKLIPLFSIAIISVSFAIFEVKNITEIKINKGLNRLPK